MKRLLPSLVLVGLAGSVSVGLEACGSSSEQQTGVGVQAIVFVQRAHTTVTAEGVSVNVAGGNAQVVDYQRYVPGGSLNLLSPARPDGTLKNVIAGQPYEKSADFNGVDVSFDAKQVIFSMKTDAHDRYHLYTAQLQPGPDGKFEIHQLTSGNYDDVSPIYIPGGRVAFVTNQSYTAMGTRADEYEHSPQVTQLASIGVENGDADRRLYAQNLSHTVAPFLRSDGRIGYSRWEHVGPVNDVKIFVANPDGTGMLAVGGQHGKPSNSLFSIREYGENRMVAIATTRNRTIHAGALVTVDARNKADAVCMDDAADHAGHVCLDEEHVEFENLTPDVPTGNGPSPVGRYREPSVLPDGRILVSWADGPVNDLAEQSITPPDFGIYVFDAKTKKNQLVYNDPKFWELNALPVVPRKEPPVIGDVERARDPSAPTRIGSLDIGQTSLNESIDGAQLKNVQLRDALRQATHVRIIEGFSSEAAKGVTMFGLTLHDGAAVVGEAQVMKDGSWLADVPPYVPVRLQPIDKFGMAIRSQTLWIQGNPGEDRRCVGCHESRTGQGVPRFGQNPTVAEQRGPEAFAGPLAERIQRGEYGWNTRVQQVLDAKCSSCHNSSTTEYYTLETTDRVTGQTVAYRIPYLDLSNAPITVTYDRRIATYNASYVSIFFPSALEMQTGNTRVMGRVPPLWGVPGSARASKMIEKINLRAADGSTAWPTPLHPEDKGVTMTDEERRTLLLPMDLGGQYYARQNTGFEPKPNDPTGQYK